MITVFIKNQDVCIVPEEGAYHDYCLGEFQQAFVIVPPKTYILLKYIFRKSLIASGSRVHGSTKYRLPSRLGSLSSR